MSEQTFSTAFSRVSELAEDFAANEQSYLKPHRQAARSDKNKNYYQDKCNALDQKIERLVFDLYGLTAGEREIVKGAA